MSPPHERGPGGSTGAKNTSRRSNTIVAQAPDLELLDAVNYAWGCGYDLGLLHGRAAERTLIDDELRQRMAAHRALAIADLPEADPALAASRDAERARRGWVE